MKWIRISIEASRDAEDALSNLLMEMGSGGVQTEDLSSGRVSIMAYFPPDDLIGERVSKINTLLRNLREMNIDVGHGRVKIDSLDEQIWTESWRDFFKPLSIGQRILVYPPWEAVALQTHRDILIQIDPGMAFGTGGHSSTRLCLELLERVVKGGERVADVGTGSGILAIAAVKLGAKEVVAVDIDTRATVVAAENFRVNGVSSSIHLICGAGLNAVKGTYNIIVSNILTKMLLPMIHDFKPYFRDDSRLILSGVLETELSYIENELKINNIELMETHHHEEWAATLAKL